MNKWSVMCLSLVVISVGCGSTSNPATKSATSSGAPAASTKDAAPTVKRDPCALLTKEEISAALGTEMREARSDDGIHCLYSDLIGGTGATVTLMTAANNIEVKSMFTAAKQVTKDRGEKGFQEIAGIGDEAYSGGGNDLNVRKGDSYFGIGLNSVAALSEPGRRDQIYADFLEKEKALAVKVLARI